MKYNFDELINREKTNAFKLDFRKLIFGTDDVIPMWVADMDFKTPDFVVNAIKKRTEHEIYGYSLRPKSFNKSIVEWMKRRHSWDIKENMIEFSPGIVPALSFCVQAYTKPGDKIIIQQPVYYPFMSVIEDNDRELVCNPLKLQDDRYFIDFEDLISKIDNKVKMLILCSPHNPVGRVWNKDALEKLGNICVENDIILVSDEIHGDLIFKPNKHLPIAMISPEIAKISVTCIAPSKTFNMAGMASSAVIIPDIQLRIKYKKVLDKAHLGIGNVFGNVAMEAAYTYGYDWLDQLLEYLQKNIDYVVEYFEKNIPQIKVLPIEGTYLLWLDCRELGLKNDDLKDFMIKKAKVGFNDGSAFGIGGESFQRMNIACPIEIIKKAVERIKIAIEYRD